jgi:hypothetical protein
MISRLLVAQVALVLAAAEAPASHPDLAPYQECLNGPRGFRACSISFFVPNRSPPGRASDDDVLPQRLVVYRNGRRLYAKDGSPFIWEFGFLDDGEKLAFQAGPLHFGMRCTLVVASTGKELDSHPCFTNDDVDAAPSWVRTLSVPHDVSREKLDPREVAKLPPRESIQ